MAILVIFGTLFLFDLLVGPPEDPAMGNLVFNYPRRILLLTSSSIGSIDGISGHLNGPAVTNGEWKSRLKPILDKYPECEQSCNGESHSTCDLAHKVRNIIAHKDPKGRDKKLIADI